VSGTHEAADLPRSAAKGVGGSGHIRAAVALLAQIDRLANDERRTRGNAIRLLLEEALRARTAKKTK